MLQHKHFSTAVSTGAAWSQRQINAAYTKVGCFLCLRGAPERFAMLYGTGKTSFFQKQAYLPQSYELFLFTPEYLPHPMIKSFDISFRSTYFYSNANKKQKTTETINVWFPATLLQHEPTQSTEVATTEPTTSSQRNLSHPSHLSCSLGTCVLQGSPPCTSLRFVSQPCVHAGRTL